MMANGQAQSHSAHAHDSNLMCWAKDDKGQLHPVPFPCCSCENPATYGWKLDGGLMRWLCSACHQVYFWEEHRLSRIADVTDALDPQPTASVEWVGIKGYTDPRWIFGTPTK